MVNNHPLDLGVWCLSWVLNKEKDCDSERQDCSRQAESMWEPRHGVRRYEVNLEGLEQLQHTSSKEQEWATRLESRAGSRFKVGTVKRVWGYFREPWSVLELGNNMLWTWL